MKTFLVIIASLVILIAIAYIYFFVHRKLKEARKRKNGERIKKLILSFSDSFGMEYTWKTCDSSIKNNTFVYVENNRDIQINEYISKHYVELRKKFRDIGGEFIYIYKYAELQKDSLLASNISPEGIHPKGDPMNVILELLGCDDKSAVSPSIIHLVSVDDEKSVYYGSYIPSNSEKELDEFFDRYFEVWDNTGISPLKNRRTEIKYSLSIDDDIHQEVRFSVAECSGIRFSRREDDDVRFCTKKEPKEECVEEETVSAEDMKILIDIQSRLDQLRNKGLAEAFLRKYLAPKQTLSKLVITKDYKFILTGYSNLEIKMPPLHKSLYILYLRHPEGIGIKELYDHKQELMIIYEKVRGGIPTDSKLRSINRLVDPFNNSIHEKLSNIRDAFESCINSELASNYIIAGPQGEAKTIKLDRSMIEWKNN